MKDNLLAKIFGFIDAYWKETIAAIFFLVALFVFRGPVTDLVNSWFLPDEKPKPDITVHDLKGSVCLLDCAQKIVFSMEHPCLARNDEWLRCVDDDVLWQCQKKCK